MKQFQFAYTNEEILLHELEKIEKWREENDAHGTLWRIYSMGTIETDVECIKRICAILKEKMPDALYLGCSTSGNIKDGTLASANTILTCTVFERETTRAELLQLPFSEENAVKAVDALKAYCEANPWVRCVELHATMVNMALQEFCDEMSTLPEEIQIFGGGANSSDHRTPTTSVFSSAGDFSHESIIFLVMGGEELYACSTYICGWKSLKRSFRVTRAAGQMLYELDGKPAFNVYKKFLSIETGDDFANSTTEFPLMLVTDDGVEVLRNPLSVNDDDSILMINDLREGIDLRLAYGDPETILNSIATDGKTIADFRPDVIQMFSCVARRIFWGDKNVSDETMPFQHVAPTSGFFSGGEFLRVGGTLYCFNMTLVLAGLREGQPADTGTDHTFENTLRNAGSGRMSLIRRFASFIEESAAELEAANNKLSDVNRQLTEVNSQLTDVNQQLALASITDGLTTLYNRAEIEKQIRSAVEDATHKGWKSMSLIMLDIDNFKRVNDVYGHKEGDRVIIALSDVLKKTASSLENAAVGRWGGEEFMVMLPNVKMDEAVSIAERIREEFSAISYETADCQTVSLGVTQALAGETADALYSRVDKALYIAKSEGRNRTIKLAGSDE